MRPARAGRGTSYDHLLELAVEVALEAADLVRARRREGVVVSGTKTSPTDVVTEHDQAGTADHHDRGTDELGPDQPAGAWSDHAGERSRRPAALERGVQGAAP